MRASRSKIKTAVINSQDNLRHVHDFVKLASFDECLMPAQVSYEAAPIAAAATIAAAAAPLKTAREVYALKRQRAAAMAADVKAEIEAELFSMAKKLLVHAKSEAVVAAAAALEAAKEEAAAKKQAAAAMKWGFMAALNPEMEAELTALLEHAKSETAVPADEAAAAKARPALASPQKATPEAAESVEVSAELIAAVLAAQGVGQQHHPSSMRNRVPILKAMIRLLPDAEEFSGAALEIATGTGALMELVAPAYPRLSVQPSEFVPKVAASPDEQWSKHGKIGIRAGLDELGNIDEHGCKVFHNVLPAVALDLSQPWPVEVTDKNGKFVLIFCVNTLHITPWECSIGLFRGAGEALAKGGHLMLYGPFRVDGEYVGADGGAGNAKFDEKLRTTNAAWGLRDVSELAKLAAGFGLPLREKVDMPANNLLLHFGKAAGAASSEIAPEIAPAVAMEVASSVDSGAAEIEAELEADEDEATSNEGTLSTGDALQKKKKKKRGKGIKPKA